MGALHRGEQMRVAAAAFVRVVGPVLQADVALARAPFSHRLALRHPAHPADEADGAVGSTDVRAIPVALLRFQETQVAVDDCTRVDAGLAAALRLGPAPQLAGAHVRQGTPGGIHLVKDIRVNRLL